MYGLKKTIDISFFIQASVSQICVSNSAIIINFDNPVKLTILSSFSVCSSNEMQDKLSSYAEDAVALFPLIGDTVTTAEATESGGLKLGFSSGNFLEIFDDSEQFESFWIKNGDDLIII